MRRSAWPGNAISPKRSRAFGPNASSSRARSRSSGCASSQSERGNSLPLSEKVRIEVYLPDLPRAAYQDLLESIDREFTYTFGGFTAVRGLDGSYLSRQGLV